MRILITSVGSHGDIHPYVGIGQALRRRGHDVALLAQPYFQRVAEDAGLEFIPVGQRLDLREIAERPYLMGAWSGTKRIMQELIIPEAPSFFRAVEAEIRGSRRPDVVLTHHICFGVTWACEKHGAPVAVGCLAPLAWSAPGAPAHFTPLTTRDPSPTVMKWWMRLARAGSMAFYDGPLNRARRELGLRPGRELMVHELRGGDVNLGLWSRHFRGPLESDPEHGHICGFSWFDRHAEQEHASAEVERFLDNGEAPIIFTLGTTAVHVAGPFYEAAAGACRMLGRRGMLLTGHADYTPRTLPPGVAAFTYAPYSACCRGAARRCITGGSGRRRSRSAPAGRALWCPLRTISSTMRRGCGGWGFRRRSDVHASRPNRWSGLFGWCLMMSGW